MAVKVMVAPAIARGELEAPRGRRAASVPAGQKKPRHRRSAVYDGDGTEVFITLMCLKCHKMRPLSQFGLRRMADGAIRNQPWCRTCRSGASPRARKEPALSGESPVGADSPGSEPASADAPAGPLAATSAAPDAGTLATQVATALDRGRG
jgi:hypothetical protein